MKSKSMMKSSKGILKAVGETGWAVATNLVASGATLT
ncbi:hypothetical protein PAAL109150_16255 [Paenibacillus alkaliterrae]